MPRVRSMLNETSELSVRRSTRRSTRLARRSTVARRISFGQVDDEDHAATTENSEIEDPLPPLNNLLPKSPGQLDAEKDAQVYIQDSCFSHALGDEPEHKHYHAGHGHSHGPSPKKVERVRSTPRKDQKSNSSKGSDRIFFFIIFILSVATSLFAPHMMAFFEDPDVRLQQQAGISKDELNAMVLGYVKENSASAISEIVSAESKLLRDAMKANVDELSLALKKLETEHVDDTDKLLEKITNLISNYEVTDQHITSYYEKMKKQDIEPMINKKSEESHEYMVNEIIRRIKENIPTTTTGVSQIDIDNIDKRISEQIKNALDAFIPVTSNISEDKVASIRDEVLAQIGSDSQIDTDAIAASITRQFDSHIREIESQGKLIESEIKKVMLSLDNHMNNINIDTIKEMIKLNLDSSIVSKEDIKIIVNEQINVWLINEREEIIKLIQQHIDPVTKSIISMETIEKMVNDRTKDFINTDNIKSMITDSTESFLTKSDVDKLIRSAIASTSTNSGSSNDGSSSSGLSIDMIKELITEQMESVETDIIRVKELVKTELRQLNGDDIGPILKEYGFTMLNDVQQLVTKGVTKLIKNQAADDADRLRLAVSTQVEALMSDIEIYIQKEINSRQNTDSYNNDDIPEDMGTISRLIDTKIALYDADRTGKVDFALYASGGKVVAASPDAHFIPNNNGESIMNLVWENSVQTNPPRTMLMPNMEVGSCWPMGGDHGWALVQLRDDIIVSSISIEHISPDIAPTSHSAPKHIKIWGISDPDTSVQQARETATTLADAVPIGDLLGEFEYDIMSSKRIQDINVNSHGKAYRFITLQVLSNHGYDVSTCIYRFRVHGKVSN